MVSPELPCQGAKDHANGGRNVRPPYCFQSERLRRGQATVPTQPTALVLTVRLTFIWNVPNKL